MTPATLLLPQLYAMRVMLEGMIAALEQEIAAAPEIPEGGCRHPPERQVNATVLGGPPQVLCLVCGQQRLGTVPGA